MCQTTYGFRRNDTSPENWVDEREDKLDGFVRTCENIQSNLNFNRYFTSLQRVYVFVIIGITLVVIGGIVIIYEIQPSLTFKEKTGFITKENAIMIIGVRLSNNTISQTTFVLLEYRNQDKNNVVNAIMYSADPSSKEPIGTGQKISILCYPCYWENQTNRFAWNIPVFDSPPCTTPNFVDASTGKFIGRQAIYCGAY